MKTSDYILIALGLALVVGSTLLLSKPRVRYTEPKYDNVKFGVDLGRSLGIL